LVQLKHLKFYYYYHHYRSTQIFNYPLKSSHLTVFKYFNFIIDLYKYIVALF
uniref:Ovule protein n=1 Tax=Strongyloides venezuelensis TaxID=75913 RepID=A0A0K0ETZ6_STRVS